MVFTHLFQWDVEDKVRVDVDLETGTTNFTVVVAIDVDCQQEAGHQIGHAGDQAHENQDITSDLGADEQARAAPAAAATQDFVPAAPSSPICSVGASIVPKVNLQIFLLLHDQQNFEIFTVKVFQPALQKS